MNVAIGNYWMTQAIAVPLVAFFCLVASVALGLATHGRPAWQMALPAPTPLLRGLAVGLLALAALALAMLTVNAGSDFRRAEAQAQILAQDATSLDEALRQAGPAAEPARTVLYRYTDAIARRLFPQQEALVLAAPAHPDGLRHELRLEIAALPAEPAAVATATFRLEVMLRTGDDLLALTPAPGLKWCRPILVAWLMLALGLLALISPPQVRSAIMLTSLAGVLSLGLYFLEEMASPFHGTFSVSRAIIDNALFAIGD
jgi:hypothetical protein